MQIQHKVYEKGGVFYINEHQKKLAEITYQWKSESTIIADHTWVDDSLKGRGVARQLLDTLVDFARESNLKIIPVCSYVEVMFKRDTGLSDVIA